MISSRTLGASFVSATLFAAQTVLWAAPLHQGHFRVIAWGDVTYDMDVAADGRAKGAPVWQIGAGDFHSLALKRDGEVFAWGDDSFGQTDIPLNLAHEGVAEVAAGNIHSMALLRRA